MGRHESPDRQPRRFVGRDRLSADLGGTGDLGQRRGRSGLVRRGQLGRVQRPRRRLGDPARGPRPGQRHPFRSGPSTVVRRGADRHRRSRRADRVRRWTGRGAPRRPHGLRGRPDDAGQGALEPGHRPRCRPRCRASARPSPDHRSTRPGVDRRRRGRRRPRPGSVDPRLARRGACGGSGARGRRRVDRAGPGRAGVDHVGRRPGPGSGERRDRRLGAGDGGRRRVVVLRDAGSHDRLPRRATRRDPGARGGREPPRAGRAARR